MWRKIIIPVFLKDLFHETNYTKEHWEKQIKITKNRFKKGGLGESPLTILQDTRFADSSWNLWGF